MWKRRITNGKEEKLVKTRRKIVAKQKGKLVRKETKTSDEKKKKKQRWKEEKKTSDEKRKIKPSD